MKVQLCAYGSNFLNWEIFGAENNQVLNVLSVSKYLTHSKNEINF